MNKFIVDKRPRNVFNNVRSIYDKAIVFLTQTGEIYTHGTYFGTQPTIPSSDYTASLEYSGTVPESTWQKVGTLLVNGAGTYAIQITTNTAIYSGTFSYTASDSFQEEILLHGSGSGTRLYAKLNGSDLYLVADSQINSLAATIKIRKLL